MTRAYILKKIEYEKTCLRERRILGLEDPRFESDLLYWAKRLACMDSLEVTDPLKKYEPPKKDVRPFYWGRYIDPEGSDPRDVQPWCTA